MKKPAASSRLFLAFFGDLAAAKSPKKAKKERLMPILLLLRARVQQNLSRKIQNHLQQNFLQQ